VHVERRFQYARSSIVITGLFESKEPGHMCHSSISVRPRIHPMERPAAVRAVACIHASARQTVIFSSPASARWDDALQYHHEQQAISYHGLSLVALRFPPARILRPKLSVTSDALFYDSSRIFQRAHKYKQVHAFHEGAFSSFQATETPSPVYPIAGQRDKTSQAAARPQGRQYCLHIACS
jgi:hypothetical protein